MSSTLVGQLTEAQFQSLFKVVYAGPVTADIANAATGSGTFGSITATVKGVKAGDLVLLITATADTDGSPRFANVSAADTVRIYTLNNSAGAQDYASETYTIVVLRPNF